MGGPDRRLQSLFTAPFLRHADHTQDTLTDNNFALLFGLVLDTILRPWEKHILTLRFSEVSLLNSLVSGLMDWLAGRHML